MREDHAQSHDQKIADSQNGYLNTTFWDIYPLFLLVQEGNTDALKDSFSLKLEAFPTKGRVANSEHKQYEYLTVSLVNSFMVAAILGGAYPPEANWIADRALKRISTFDHYQEIPPIVYDAAIELCELTHAAKEQDSGNLYVEQAKRYLMTHLTQPINNEQVAAALGLSPFYLGRLFKACTGQTMHAYLIEERIKTAKHLLEADNQSITQISSLLCFCDQSYFTQVFRKHTGLTPRQYRMTHSRQ